MADELHPPVTEFHTGVSARDCRGNGTVNGPRTQQAVLTGGPRVRSGIAIQGYVHSRCRCKGASRRKATEIVGQISPL